MIHFGSWGDRRTMPEHETVVPEGFALFEDGPFLQLVRRSPALKPLVESPARRALAAVAITWFPLLVLSIHGGRALHGSPLPFLKDIQTQIRMLVTLPLYVVAGHEAHRIVTPAMRLFVTRGVVRDNDREKFTSILRTASGWNHSVILRVAVIAIILFFGQAFWKHELASRQLSAWYDEQGTSDITLTLAGSWLTWVANPIFQYLHLLWFLRLLLYAVMLARIAALDLHLVATHPDRAGGIGFLGSTVYSFKELVVAEGAVVAGVLANRIFHEGRPLTLFTVYIAFVTVMVALLVLGPLCVFVPRLLAARRRGLGEYSDVSNRYVRAFEEAWVVGQAEAEGRELLGASDVQSLADMANSYQVVVQMRSVPFSNRTAIEVVEAFLLPISPLVLTVIPLEDLITKLVKGFMG
jgi:hypothetical protein